MLIQADVVWINTLLWLRLEVDIKNIKYAPENDSPDVCLVCRMTVCTRCAALNSVTELS